MLQQAGDTLGHFLHELPPQFVVESGNTNLLEGTCFREDPLRPTLLMGAFKILFATISNEFFFFCYHGERAQNTCLCRRSTCVEEGGKGGIKIIAV